jgi:hypothetical protein
MVFDGGTDFMRINLHVASLILESPSVWLAGTRPTNAEATWPSCARSGLLELVELSGVPIPHLKRSGRLSPLRAGVIERHVWARPV